MSEGRKYIPEAKLEDRVAPIREDAVSVQVLAQPGGEAHDPAHRPRHYTQGSREVIEVIKEQVPNFASYCEGNILKYILRWRHKNGVEDLEKARVYLGWLIDHLQE